MNIHSLWFPLDSIPTHLHGSSEPSKGFDSIKGIIESTNRPHIVLSTSRGFVNTSDSWDAFHGKEPRKGQVVDVLMRGSRVLSVRP